ncbi:MAG: GFA family protein [Gammaproteobacteria bacterium]
MMIKGGCLCGAVRYQFSAAPLTTRACWCRFCQYIGAGSATVNACFPSDALEVHGELRDYVSTADSGNKMHRRFCSKCGVHLFSAAESRPHLVFARVGTLEDPELARPTATIWTAAAPSWACIDPSLPRIEGQPPPVA